MENKTDLLSAVERFLRGRASTSEEMSLLKRFHTGVTKPEDFKQLVDQAKDKLVQTPDQTSIEQWNKLQSLIVPGQPATDKRRLSQGKAIFQIGKYAAILLLGFVLASIIRVPVQKEPYTKTVSQIQTISTPKGSRSNFTLPDGSKVWLNAGSALSFVINEPENRSVELHGEAYFEVVKNNQPFTVQTIYGSVLVKGTSFNVKAFENDDFLTTVESGLVSVSLSGNSNQLELNPGEQSYQGSQNQLQKHAVNTKIFTSWREGKLVFYKDPLSNIVKKLERWYNVEIKVTPQTKLKNYRFTGTIEMESLTEVLELIRVTAPIKYSYDSKNRTVVIDTKEI